MSPSVQRGKPRTGRACGVVSEERNGWGVLRTASDTDGWISVCGSGGVAEVWGHSAATRLLGHVPLGQREDVCLHSPVSSSRGRAAWPAGHPSILNLAQAQAQNRGSSPSAHLPQDQVTPPAGEPGPAFGRSEEGTGRRGPSLEPRARLQAPHLRPLQIAKLALLPHQCVEERHVSFHLVRVQDGQQ